MQGELPITSYGAPGSQYAAWRPKSYVDLSHGGHGRRRLNWISVIASLFVPWLIFAFVCGLLSFHIHYQRPGLCFFGVLVALIVVILCGVFALQEYKKSKAEGQREPTWFRFLFVTSSCAWLLGLALGFANYWSYTQPHYAMVALNTYSDVDVAAISGSGVMDVGRMSFKAGSYIDTSRAMGFKKVDTYCVAPVTSTNIPLLNYDFWVTGVNCCSGEPGDFHCGEVDGKLKLGGAVRVLNNAEIPWFTLATQQAEAYHHMRVGHAIFFKNVADPLGASSLQLDHGVKFYCLCTLLCFGLQFVALLVEGILREGVRLSTKN